MRKFEGKIKDISSTDRLNMEVERLNAELEMIAANAIIEVDIIRNIQVIRNTHIPGHYEIKGESVCFIFDPSVDLSQLTNMKLTN